MDTDQCWERWHLAGEFQEFTDGPAGCRRSQASRHPTRVTPRVVKASRAPVKVRSARIKVSRTRSRWIKVKNGCEKWIPCGYREVENMSVANQGLAQSSAVQRSAKKESRKIQVVQRDSNLARRTERLACLHSKRAPQGVHWNMRQARRTVLLGCLTLPGSSATLAQRNEK